MKIIIVGPSLKMGGMERASGNLANSLSEFGHKIIYLSLFNQEKFFKLNSDILFFEPIDFNSTSLSLFKLICWLRKNIKSQNADRIIVFNKFYSAITIISCFGLREKIIVSERSSPLYKWKKSMAWFSNLVFFFFNPTGIIAQTSIAATYQKRYYGSDIPIVVIPNVVRNVEVFPLIKRKNTILAIGRLNDPLKGLDRLIEAFILLKNKNWKLLIAGGDNDEGKYLIDHISNSEIVQNIVFLGKVKDLDPILAEAGIYVIPSRSEGFPNALCEAMAAGLPCISFDFIAGPRDIIVDGINGIIVEDGNIDKMASRIDFLIENPALRNELGQKAKEIKYKLNGEAIARQTIAFLEQL